MAPVLLLLLHVSALAATLGLPSGEPPSAWTTPARLAGFSLAPPAQAADVLCVADPQGWMIRVEGLDGSVRTERVAAPSDSRAREDLAWLASSLLSEVEARAGGARPALPASLGVPPPTAPAPPKPRSAAVSHLPPPPRPSALAPASSPPAPPTPTPLEIPRPPTLAAAALPEPQPLPAHAPPSRERPDLHPWVELSPGYSRRAGLTAAATLSIRSGIGLQSFRTGLAATLPTAREVIGTDGALRTFDLCARAAWSPDWTLAPQLGVELGISEGEWSVAGERLLLHAEQLGCLVQGESCGDHRRNRTAGDPALRNAAARILSDRPSTWPVLLGCDRPRWTAPVTGTRPRGR